MKVFFTYPANSEFNDWEREFVAYYQRELNESDTGNRRLADDAETADLIVFVESQKWKDPQQATRLEGEPLLSSFPDKVVTINYEDSPAGYLRGAYSSLEPGNFDPSLHISWPLLFLPNYEVYRVTTADSCNRRPRHLFSFAGAVSHPLRGRLLQAFAGKPGDHKVVEVNRSYKHTSADKQIFVSDILDSSFILCPRGAASYSHRISEVMALGRVPVVIADRWVPFSLPKQDYYIRVAESDVEKIPEILGGRRHEAAALGMRAREIWVQYFSEGKRAQAIVEALSGLRSHSTGMTLRDYKQRWSSRPFRRANGLTPEAQLRKWVRRQVKRLRLS